MKISEIESRMREIWRETFGDTEEYVDLLFNAYFNPRYCSWKIENGDVASMLFGIPYEFRSEQLGSFKALYLCGLATLPQYRKRGLMGELMREIEQRGAADGFDATFLIPADSKLRRYYRGKGYQNTERKDIIEFNLEGIISIRDCLTNSKDDIKLIDGDDYTQYEIIEITKNNAKYNTELIERLILESKKHEKTNYTFGIRHTKYDFEKLIEEKLLSNSSIILSENNNQIFCVIIIDESGVIWPLIGSLKIIFKTIINYVISGDNDKLSSVSKIFKINFTNPEMGTGIVSDISDIFINNQNLKIRKGDGEEVTVNFGVETEWAKKLEAYGMIKFLEKPLIRENRIFEERLCDGRENGKNENGGDLPHSEEVWRKFPEIVHFSLVFD